MHALLFNKRFKQFKLILRAIKIKGCGERCDTGLVPGLTLRSRAHTFARISRVVTDPTSSTRRVLGGAASPRVSRTGAFRVEAKA